MEFAYKYWKKGGGEEVVCLRPYASLISYLLTQQVENMKNSATPRYEILWQISLLKC